VWFFPSQASSPYYYDYFEEVALILLLQLVHFKFKLLDFSLQVIIFFRNLFITSFHTYLACGGYHWLRSSRCLTKGHQIALQNLDVSLVRHHIDLKKHQLSS
jgi:hypothetical protein